MLLAETKIRKMKCLERPGVNGSHSSKIYNLKKPFGDELSREHGSWYRLSMKLSWYEVTKLTGN